MNVISALSLSIVFYLFTAAYAVPSTSINSTNRLPPKYRLTKNVSTQVVELNYRNTAVFDGDVDGSVPDLVFGSVILKRMTSPDGEPVFLVINSGGGRVDLGGMLIQELSTIPNLVLVCQNCESMAAGLFEAVPTSPRLVTKYSQILLHEMYQTMYSSSTVADLKELQDSGAAFNTIFYTRMGWTKEKYQKAVYRSQIVFTGADIVKNGLADRVVTFSCDNYVKMFALGVCK